MKYFIVVSLLLSIIACNPAQKSAKAILSMETEVMQDAKNGKVDTGKIGKLIDQYQAYITANPKDSLCPSYLMKSGDLFRGSLLPAKAVACYQRVWNEYPTYPRAHLALFLSAFLYENELHDMGRAKSCYEQYIKLYPDTKLAKDATFSLQNLGKSPEQLLREMDSVRQASGDSSAHQGGV